MHRIYVFSGKKILTLLMWFVLSALQLVSDTSNVFKTTLALSLSTAAVQDILIAIFLVFLLVRERTDTLFASTAHMVQRLTVLAVNTGTWTATFGLLSLIFMYVWPSEKLYVLFIYPICSIYCNTVLANLNARSYLSDRSGVRRDRVDLVTGASAFSGGQTELVFAQPELALQAVSRPGTAELVTSSDTNVSTR